MDKKELLDSLDRTDVFLLRMIESEQRNLERAISRLSDRLMQLAGQIEANPMTKYVEGPDAWDYSRTDALLRQLDDYYRATYGAAALAFGDKFTELLVAVRDDFTPLGIRLEFSTFDREFISAAREVAAAGLDAFGAQAVNRVQQALVNVMAGASTIDELTDEIAAALTGETSTRGTPLSSYASRFAHDATMDTYSTIHRRKARDAGISTFLYAGNVSAKTRSFCAARAGKTFTESEIDSWNGQSWKGKRPGDVWINRGGYNCRHHLRAVLPDMIPKDGIEVGDYFSEESS